MKTYSTFRPTAFDARTMNTGLRTLKTVIPVETPTAKLIRMLLEHMELANTDLLHKNSNGAQANLEYGLFMANELLCDYPEIAASFYTGKLASKESTPSKVT